MPNPIINRRIISGQSLGAGQPWVTGGVPTGAVLVNSLYTLGCQFTVNANMYITALGWWRFSIAEADVCMSIQTEAGAGVSTTLVQASIAAASGTAGAFNYASISPLLLSGGTTYRISGIPLAGGSVSYYDVTGSAPTVNSNATLVSGAYTAFVNCATYAANLFTPGRMYGPVNFKFVLA